MQLHVGEVGCFGSVGSVSIREGFVQRVRHRSGGACGFKGLDQSPVIALRPHIDRDSGARRCCRAEVHR